MQFNTGFPGRDEKPHKNAAPADRAGCGGAMHAGPVGTGEATYESRQTEPTATLVAMREEGTAVDKDCEEGDELARAWAAYGQTAEEAKDPKDVEGQEAEECEGAEEVTEVTQPGRVVRPPSDEPETRGSWSVEAGLLARMTAEGGDMAEVVRSGIGAEVFETPINHYVFGWMVDYHRENRLAPTWRVMCTEYPSLFRDLGDNDVRSGAGEVPHPEDVEEATGWLIDQLRTRHARNHSQKLIRAAAEASQEDPLVAMDTLVTGWQQRRAALGDTDGRSDKIVTGGAFVLDVPTEFPSLWGEGQRVLWPEGESLMIAAPLGVGKTTLAGLLLRAQLLGGFGYAHVLGMPVKKTSGKVLYLAMDRPAQAARALNRQFKPEHREVLDDRLVIWKGPPLEDMARKPEVLLRMAEDAGAETVYLDSIKDAAIGLSEDAVGAGYNRARQMLLAEGRQLCELHHLTKTGTKDSKSGDADITAIYGSAWLTNGAGSVLVLNGSPTSTKVRAQHQRKPAEAVPDLTIDHDHRRGEMTVRARVDLEHLAETASKDGSGLSAKVAAAHMFGVEEPDRNQVESGRRALEALARDGKLATKPGTKGGTNGGTPTTWVPAR